MHGAIDYGAMQYKYPELINLCAQYGYGVFCVPMVGPCQMHRMATHQFIRRNRELFQRFSSPKKEVTVFCLTAKGRRRFELVGYSPRGKSFSSYLDIVLVNAYMAEIGIWAKHSAKPHSITTLPNGKTISVLSRNNGIPRTKTDVLLADPAYSDFILRSPERIGHLATVSKVSVMEVGERVRGAITPASLCNMAPIF